MNVRAPSVDVVALDMIGVIIQEEKLISRGFVEYFGSQLRVDVDEIKKRYDEGYAIGATTREAFWDGVLDEDWRDAEAGFLAARRVAPAARQVVAEVSRTRRIAVVSDMPREWATATLSQHGVMPYVSVAVFSNDGLGSKKDGRLFEALCDQAGVSPDKILLVDDRIRNLDTAWELGFQCAWLPLDPDAADETAFPRLTDLTDIVSLLQRREPR